MSVRKRKDTVKTRWTARWKSPENKWKTKDFPTRKEAERFEAQMKSDVLRGDYTNPHAGKTLLKDVYSNWKQTSGRLKPKSIATNDSLWKCLVEPKWGNRQISSITRAEVAVWASEAISITGKKVSQSRIRQSAFLLNTLLTHAYDMGLINRVVIGKMKGIVPKLEEPAKKQTLTIEELQMLANSCGEFKLFILVAGLLGLRWAELLALNPDDFDFKNKTIQINKSLSEINGRFELVTTKTGKSRYVPIPDSIQKELMEKVMATPADALVFRSTKGGNLRSSNFARRVFIPALKNAGLPRIKFHDLRHTAVTNLIHSGVNIVSVSKAVGHSKPTTTLNIYAHELSDHQDSIRNAIDANIADSACDRSVTDSDSKSA